MKNRNIVVFCGSSFGDDPVFASFAGQVGQEIGKRGFSMVYGGGSVGLMGVTADAALSAGAEVTGIIPTLFIEREEAHRGISHLIEVPSLSVRKEKLIQAGGAFIILPGGAGTLEEFSDTLSYFHIHHDLEKPPILLADINFYYEPLRELLQSAVRHQFLPARDAAPVHFCRTVEEIFSYIG